MSASDDYDYDSDDYDYDSDDYHHEQDDDADPESVKAWSNAYAHLLPYSSTSRTTNSTIKITPQKPIALLKESESKTNFGKISSNITPSNLLSTNRQNRKPTPKPSAKPTNYPTSRPNQK